MGTFRLSAEAMEDLKAIGRYTQQKWGREQRNKYLSRIDASFRLIAQEPQIGMACDYIRHGYRKYHVGRHLVFYRQGTACIEIIRILHDRMDVEQRLTET